MSKISILIAGVALLLGGCTLMPKYERPKPPVSESWANDSAETNAISKTAAEIDWRGFFFDPRLQNLIYLALVNNRDFPIRALRVEQARPQFRIQASGAFPGF